MRRGAPRREWDDAVDRWAGIGCLICGNNVRELAHTIGRTYDRPRAPGSKTLYVHPDSVVPLCKEHHTEYDGAGLNLLPHLRRLPAVVAWAVERIGEGRAMRAIMGREAFMTIQLSEE